MRNGKRVWVNRAAIAVLLLGLVSALTWSVILSSDLTATRNANQVLGYRLAGAESELNSTRREKANVETELASTRNELETTQREKADVEAELASTRSGLATTQREKINVEAELASTKSELVTTQGEKVNVEAELASTKSELATTQEEKANVEAELAGTKSELATTREEKSSVEQRLRYVQQSVEDLNGQLSELRSSVGSIDDLRDEISRLEGERRALVPRIVTRNLKCTGSMEPKLTCLDTVDLLINYRYSDIVIGAVVSFKDGSHNTLHRVMGVRENAVLTKGDSNPKDDGWISKDRIVGYVVKVNKNVNMHNAELRRRVNNSSTTLDHAQEEYEKLRLHICGRLDSNEICYTSQSNINRLDRSWEAYLDAYCGWWGVYQTARNQGEPLPVLRLPPAVCAGRL